MRRAGQQGRQGRPDRRGGTSRTGAKRAGECDGLTGLPEAIEATWPQATVQTCVVHLIRASMRFVSYGDRRKVAAALKTVYTAPSQEAAWQALTDFSESDMGVKYPQTVTTWERAWERFTPFLDFPPMLRRVIYTTNSIESLNYQLRKVSKNRGHFPSDEAVVKLLWLAICDIEDKRARERDKEKGLPASKRKAKGRLVEGQITTAWNKALAQPRHRLPRPNQPLPVKRLHRKLDRPCAGRPNVSRSRRPPPAGGWAGTGPASPWRTVPAVPTTAQGGWQGALSGASSP